jgi:hypothetical protein
MAILQEGDSGPDVRALQDALAARGYSVLIDGDFGAGTTAAVRAFQAQNLDPQGAPLVIDGKVGHLTSWSLRNDKPQAQTVPNVDFTQMPEAAQGGTPAGLSALSIAVAELRAGAREVGGDNRGPFVKKYLAPARVPEGNSWCAAFVSWCFLQASGGDAARMPIGYSPGARAVLVDFQRKGWAKSPESGYAPRPGDCVFWWRVRADGWQGHMGFVHHVKDGFLYTIEGNRSARVEGFSHVLSRMEKLLGFGSVGG